MILIEKVKCANLVAVGFGPLHEKMYPAQRVCPIALVCRGQHTAILAAGADRNSPFTSGVFFPLLVVTFCTANVFYSTTAPKKSLTGVISGPLLQWAGMTKESLMETQLMLQVQQIFDESQQRFGAEKIRIILAENGIHVGKKRIRGILQELGLESVRENAACNWCWLLLRRHSKIEGGPPILHFIVIGVDSTFREPFTHH